MALVTVYFPLTISGRPETVVQTPGETRFVANCKVNPVKFVGHVKITLELEALIVSWGRLTGPTPILNMVPKPEPPPLKVVPYRILLDKIKPPNGSAPSLPPVKSCRFVNPVPS